jgi:hypothetical protein
MFEPTLLADVVNNIHVESKSFNIAADPNGTGVVTTVHYDFARVDYGDRVLIGLYDSSTPDQDIRDLKPRYTGGLDGHAFTASEYNEVSIRHIDYHGIILPPVPRSMIGMEYPFLILTDVALEAERLFSIEGDSNGHERWGPSQSHMWNPPTRPMTFRRSEMPVLMGYLYSNPDYLLFFSEETEGRVELKDAYVSDNNGKLRVTLEMRNYDNVAISDSLKVAVFA